MSRALKLDGFHWIDILDTDSYKLSHWTQYPPKTTWMQSYLESRGGEGPETVFFGLQYIMKRYFQPILGCQLLDVARIEKWTAMHGLPFNKAAWERIDNLGYFPVKIRAVPEGSIVKKGVPLMTVESTDPETFWIVSWLETMLSRLWYPINVATISYQARHIIQHFLDETSDATNASALFKLHDFGSRGSSSQESAAIAGMAHLLSFRGTDTVAALLYASEYYDAQMAGYSIPASEHSTITMWGKERECAAYENMIDQYGGGLYACVSDSYNLFSAIYDMWGGALKEKVLARGGSLVVRPDSGDPVEISVATVNALAKQFGATKNSKGYFDLNPAVRVIYGDGINRYTIHQILEGLKTAGYSASNIAFGMGGALVQHHNRDTHKMAFKCCAATVDGKLVPVYKDPSTDAGKRSKAGIQDHDQLRTVYENGKLLIEESFDEIRERLWPSVLAKPNI